MLRDSSDVIQLACKGIDEASKATIESSIEVKGTVKEDKRAPGGYEIQVKELKIVGLAEKFPISKDYLTNSQVKLFKIFGLELLRNLVVTCHFTVEFQNLGF